MPRSLLRLLLASLLAGAIAPNALADVPDWSTDRVPGGALPSEPLPPPSGWQMGLTMTAPMTIGLGMAYLWPGAPASFKLGGSWGMIGPTGAIGLWFQDWRVYGSLVYDLVPNAAGGPYLETGLDVTHSSAANVIKLGWPVVPHIGFGTTGYLNRNLAWDVNFSALANGLLVLQGGLFY